MYLPDYITEIKTYLMENNVPPQPEAAVILGSGLGGFTDLISDKVILPYKSIPGFPSTTVAGHSGELISGTVEGHSVIAFSGRFHHYEGYSFQKTVVPVHISKALKTGKLIISNAAGAVNTMFRVGDLMVIDSIIRQNYLRAPLTYTPYRYNLEESAYEVRNLATEIGITLQQGTYLFTKGPNYETKAEIQAFRTMGTDVVGMSTVAELSEASRLQIKTAAISLITNMAAGIAPGKLDHSEVKKAADAKKDEFGQLVAWLIKKL